ncbi:mannan endo-1,6-alpha-mannosidase [Hortaea werneckii]|uniref:Mannan endo-1,6-alpha-mannosidase n=1 Tax=Hortaea werneckii TaxID=91943 RepID=A0A3M7BJ92_HORWE|nr:mannan endo-1,6-alpha-mannosidase [Hortaea werneckii]KAI7714312.1 mannan endo-1,6-alpha-mannosidase [Hortaea werneckii]RMY39841.1 hypothetical protein D0865_12715 [Hortaea werneckii]
MRAGSLLAVAAAGLPAVGSLQLDVDSTDSIRNAASTLAYGMMDYYQNNQSTTPPTDVGTMPPPLYWWMGGAVWGGLIDFWAYTNDTRYNPTIQQGLMAQTGPDNNYMPPAYYYTLGNDDQTFWALACLSAIEYGFPVPEGNSSTMYLDLAIAVFNSQVYRWDDSSCNGGLKWQVFESRSGYHYKNSISNGGFFQMASRLARYTGNQTYLDWAEKSWDWMWDIGLIDANYNVFDGTNDLINCSEIDHTAWSYNPSMLLYGTAILYNYTDGSASEMWQERTNGLVESCARNFFGPFDNATNVAYEPSCEPSNDCNYDQKSFKAYLARWMSKASVVAPYISESVNKLLTDSAEAAAEACSGGTDGVTCGQKWYTGEWDSDYGISEQLSALEVVQSLLLLDGDAVRQYPRTNESVRVRVESSPTTTLSLETATSTASGAGEGSSDQTTTATSAQSTNTDTSQSSESGSDEEGDGNESSANFVLPASIVTWFVLPVAAGLMFIGLA